MILRADSGSTSPAYNLAFEEYICGLGAEAFMLWRNSPSVIVGRFQDVESEVHTDFAAAHGIQVIRRNSGGGAVYHDLGNVNYSFILRRKTEYTLEYFAGIMIDILAGMGILQLELRHNDILAGGRKVSGMAQFRSGGMILHHGTLLFDSDIGVMSHVLRRCGDVANIKPLLREDISVDEFMTAIHDNVGISEKLVLTQNDYDNVNGIMLRKYLSPQWNNSGQKENVYVAD